MFSSAYGGDSTFILVDTITCLGNRNQTACDKLLSSILSAPSPFNPGQSTDNPEVNHGSEGNDMQYTGSSIFPPVSTLWAKSASMMAPKTKKRSRSALTTSLSGGTHGSATKLKRNIEPKDTKLQTSIDNDKYVDGIFNNPKLTKIQVEKCGKRLGEGGFSYVDMYSYSKNNEVYRCALKRAKNDEYSKAELAREVDVLSTIKHENIISFLGVYTTDKVYCMAMPLCAMSLYEEIQYDTEVPFYMKCCMLRDILSAGDFLERKDMVHCDLAAKNILISHDFKRLLVADFGKAHYEGSTIGFEGECKYMAPELSPPKQRYPDKNSDRFSLATIFYQILKWKCLEGFWFYRHELPQNFYQHVNDCGRPVTPGGDINDQFTLIECFRNTGKIDSLFDPKYKDKEKKVFEEIVMGMMDKNPQSRMSSHEAELTLENILKRSEFVTDQNSQVELTQAPLQPNKYVEKNAESNVSHVKNEQLPESKCFFD